MTTSNSITFQRSRVVSRQVGLGDLDNGIEAHGTIIKIHSLFSNLPVRFKQQALRCDDAHETERQFEAVKLRLVAHLLAHAQPVSLRLSTADGRSHFTHKRSPQARETHQTFSIANLERTLRQAGLSTAGASNWKAASAKSEDVSLRLAVSLIPAPSKHCQFVSIGHYPVPRRGLGELIYEEVNRAFETSHFGSVDLEEQERSAQSDTTLVADHRKASLRSGVLKNVNRWSCFYLRIDTMTDSGLSDVCTSDSSSDELPVSLREVVSLMHTLLEQFLLKHCFQPQKRRVVRRHQTFPLGPAPQPSVFRTNSAYGHWRRTKGSGPLQQSDVQDGLPFAGPKAPEAPQSYAASEFEILLGDNELDTRSPSDDEGCICVEHGMSEPDLDHGAGVTGSQDLSWRDPRSGHHLRLDPCNGFVVAQERRERPTDSGNDVLAGSPQTVKLVSGTGPSTISNIDLVSRLNHWPARTSTSKEEPLLQSTTSMDETGCLHAQPEGRQHEYHVHARDLGTATILRQVDAKFILALTTNVAETSTPECGPRLVFVDQHAADERVKVEDLYLSLCSGQITAMPRPLIFEINSKESRLFTKLQDYFRSWCFRYTIEKASEAYTLSVTHLPEVVAERCRLLPRTLIELLRREIWSDQARIILAPSEAWLTRINSCPSQLLDLINSRACRSAIMFNDILTREQCEELLSRLSICVLPFQCAHGRPSMTVLADLTDLDIGNDVQETTSFGKAMLDWRT